MRYSAHLYLAHMWMWQTYKNGDGQTYTIDCNSNVSVLWSKVCLDPGLIAFLTLQFLLNEVTVELHKLIYNRFNPCIRSKAVFDFKKKFILKINKNCFSY